MGIDGRKEIITPIGRPIRFVDAEPSGLLLTDPSLVKSI